jgi:bla regulator protein blaR1
MMDGMRHHYWRKRLSLKIVGPVAVTVPLIVCLPNAPSNAQTTVGETSSRQPGAIPRWQAAAGGKMSFEVASVRQDPSGKFVTPPYSMDSDDDYGSTGGLFTADATLTFYISFAYKLNQLNPMLSHLPIWTSTEHFEIRARATGNPTKDQVRLMIQSLLADRFKLAIHFETRELPVLALELIKPGKLGPNLRLHADGPACDVVAPTTTDSKANIDMFPCGTFIALNKPDHVVVAGARNTTAGQMAAFFSNVGHLSRPVVDQTELRGRIDFAMEFAPEPRGDAQPSLLGDTFLEAAKEQLGLKLEPKKVLVDIPVVDHVEMPSEN